MKQGPQVMKKWVESRLTRYRTDLERPDVEPGSCTQKERIMKLEEKAETGEAVDRNRKFSVMLNNV